MKYSVIIPIYNMEKFLNESLESVSRQTFGDFEVILVDDCSDDDSRRLADQWCTKDDRFSLISLEKNQGVSVARNSGLERAKGDYVIFMDPDDLWDEKLISSVDDALNDIGSSTEKGICDLLIFGFSEEYFDEKGNVTFERQIVPEDFCYDMSKATAHRMIMTLESQTMLGYPWNKVYNRKLLEEGNIRFPEGQSFAEDIMFNADVLTLAKNISGLKASLYHYRNMPKARLTSGRIEDYWQLQKGRVNRLLRLMSELGAKPDEKAYASQVMAGVYFRSFMSMIMREQKAGTDKKALYELCKKEAEDKLFSRMAASFVAKSKTDGILYGPLLKKDFYTAFRRAKEVDFAKNNLAGLFNRLKTKR